MPEASAGGRGRGRGNPNRGRGRGRSRRSGGGRGNNNGNKGGDATTPSKPSSKGNNDAKPSQLKSPPNKVSIKVVDPVEEKFRLMGDQVSIIYLSTSYVSIRVSF